MSQPIFIKATEKTRYFWPVVLISPILVGWATANLGFLVPGLLLALVVLGVSTVVIFKNPKLGLLSFISFCFTYTLFDRELGGGVPYQNVSFALIGLTVVAAIVKRDKEYQWGNIKKDLCSLGFAWMGINILQLFNSSWNIMGWLADAKYPLLWVLLIPLCMAIFYKKKDLDLFLILIISLSLFAAFYGIKQMKIGLTPAEKLFVVSSPTHLIFGNLRVFSFYSDAGQFGASMAHLCVISTVLALGPYQKWKKIICAIASLIFLYVMFTSGTRGALFALFTGAFVFLALTKNFKIIFIGGILAFISFFFLKYTYIGHHIYEIKRMRSALNPNDPSLQVRLYNQARLADYLKDFPFGGGVGSIGYAAKEYAPNSYLASIPPDSFWVKVWAMYGITGLTIWFGIILYIIGKCCGIVWNIHDRGLKYKLIALTAGSAGIFLCSYGNEVINIMPSSVIVYISWAFVFLGPQLDNQIKLQNRPSHA